MTVDVTLRPAEPTIEDGLAFAEYLDQAADGIFALLLGRRTPSIIAEAFVSTGHDLSHEHVTIAERGGRPVGMLSAYTGSAHAQSSTAELNRAAGWRRIRMIVVALPLLPMLSFSDRVARESFYIQAIAVDPAERGAGIGSMLMSVADAAAESAGSANLALDVAEHNDGARRLYERLGFEVAATSRPVPFVRRSRLHRMIKPLP